MCGDLEISVSDVNCKLAMNNAFNGHNKQTHQSASSFENISG